MITSSVLAAISAFSRSHIFVQDYFQDLYPNLWLLNATQSGQFKSTALMKGAELVQEKAEEVALVTKQYNRDIEIASTEEEKAALKFQRLEASIGNVLLPNKVTTEALLEHMAYGHGGVILASEFGGWLQSMEQKHNSPLKALLTELFDVPPTYHYKTKTQGDNNIIRPYLTICAVSTMPWIRNHITLDDVSSGFFARFLIFMPPYQGGIPDALPSVISPEESMLRAIYKQRVKDIIARIMSSSRIYALSGPARALFKEIHKQIYTLAHSYGDSQQDTLDPYVKRWSPYVIKLAMLIQPFENVDSPGISETSLQAAAMIVRIAIRSTAQLFAQELGISEHQRKCDKLYAWIRKRFIDTNLAVPKKAILQSRKLTGGSKEYNVILETLVESGLLEEIRTTKKMDWSYIPLVDGKPVEKVESVAVDAQP